jgi:hypothetical protein
MRPGADVAAFSTPAAGAQATASLAALGATQKWVCTSISWTVSGTAGQSATLNLRAGTTGAGTVIWSRTCVIPANGIWSGDLSNISIAGAYNTAMTLEFSAGVASQTESVAFTAYSTS